MPPGGRDRLALLAELDADPRHPLRDVLLEAVDDVDPPVLVDPQHLLVEPHHLLGLGLAHQFLGRQEGEAVEQDRVGAGLAGEPVHLGDLAEILFPDQELELDVRVPRALPALGGDQAAEVVDDALEIALIGLHHRGVGRLVRRVEAERDLFASAHQQLRDLGAQQDAVGGEILDRQSARFDSAQKIVNFAMEERLATARQADGPRAHRSQLAEDLLEAGHRDLVLAAQRGGGTEEAIDVATILGMKFDMIRTAVGHAILDPFQDGGLVLARQVIPAKLTHDRFLPGRLQPRLILLRIGGAKRRGRIDQR